MPGVVETAGLLCQLSCFERDVSRKLRIRIDNSCYDNASGENREKRLFPGQQRSVFRRFLIGSCFVRNILFRLLFGRCSLFSRLDIRSRNLRIDGVFLFIIF